MSDSPTTCPCKNCGKPLRQDGSHWVHADGIIYRHPTSPDLSAPGVKSVVMTASEQADRITAVCEQWLAGKLNRGDVFIAMRALDDDAVAEELRRLRDFHERVVKAAADANAKHGFDEKHSFAIAATAQAKHDFALATMVQAIIVMDKNR